MPERGLGAVREPVIPVRLAFEDRNQTPPCLDRSYSWIRPREVADETSSKDEPLFPVRYRIEGDSQTLELLIPGVAIGVLPRDLAKEAERLGVVEIGCVDCEVLEKEFTAQARNRRHHPTVAP